jgi:hypothetical protein
MAGDLIDSHIKKKSESKRKKTFLSFEQKSPLLSEFHTYSFNVRLGMKVTYTSSTSSTTNLKSLAIVKA